MPTKVEVRSGVNTGIDIHEVEGKPDDLSTIVNEAIVAKEKFVTFDVPGGKKLSVVAERIEAIWEE